VGRPQPPTLSSPTVRGMTSFPPAALTQSPPLKLRPPWGRQPPPGARTVRNLIACSCHRTGHDTGPTTSHASRSAPPEKLRLGGTPAHPARRPAATPAVQPPWSPHLSPRQIGRGRRRSPKAADQTADPPSQDPPSAGTATFPLGPALCHEISDGHRPFNEAPSGPCPLACNSQCPAGEARQPHHRPRATPASSLRALPTLPLSNPLCPVGAAPPPPTHAPPPAQLPQPASLRPADCSLRCATCSPPAAASPRAPPMQLRAGTYSLHRR
jgi:hypothetical protein